MERSRHILFSKRDASSRLTNCGTPAHEKAWKARQYITDQLVPICTDRYFSTSLHCLIFVIFGNVRPPIVIFSFRFTSFVQVVNIIDDDLSGDRITFFTRTSAMNVASGLGVA